MTAAALPPALARHPLPRQWLAFAAGDRVLVSTGKVELGQGIHTALAQIVAEALRVDLGCVQVRAADTDTSPDEGMTSGSLSVQDSGAALARVAAVVRERCRQAAARRWAVDPTRVALVEGCWRAADGRALGYAELAGSALMSLPVTGDELLLEELGDGPTPRSAVGRGVHHAVGRSVPRPELQALIGGASPFIHDLELPGLLQGRVLRPPLCGGQLVGFDPAAVQAMQGVLLVHRDGNLVGLLATSNGAAHTALQRLRETARWLAPSEVPPGPAPMRVVDDQPAPSLSAARTLRARYSKPRIAHASIGPACALARWQDGRLQVWSHSQGIFSLRRDLALAFGLDVSGVSVQHVPGAGCYGHNGADDVAFDAAWLARQRPGQPVRLLWTRADERAWAAQGPAMQVELEADLDGVGAVVAWRHDIWSPGHSSRPGRSIAPALLGSWQTAQPFERPPAIDVPLAMGGGAERNAVPAYRLPGWRVRCHRVDEGPLRSSALRALGAFANVFAAESFVDEIAVATARDPLDWRLAHLAHDPRACQVLRLVSDRAGWRAAPRRPGVGQGLAFARYKNTGAWCAVVAEVEAAARLQVLKLWFAVDVGRPINPDGVVQQIEGGAIQATSWTLKEGEPPAPGDEAVDPMLRFTEVPAIDVQLVASTQPSLGAGEAALGPTAAAIANALFDALGLRVRDLPLSPERIVATMDESV